MTGELAENAYNNSFARPPEAMQVPDTARRALLLIGATTILLAVILGTIDWLIETEKVDDEVVSLAQREARALTDDHLQLLARPDASKKLAALFSNERQHNFPIIELYDQNRRKVVEVIVPGREAVEQALQRLPEHGFPFGDTPHYRRLTLQDGVYLQVLLPLNDARGQLAGYFEGVYQVPAETLAAIQAGLFRAVAMVILSVLISGAVIYPLILRLNHNVLATSRALLQGNLELMEVMGAAIAKRDSDTHAHNYRVTLYSLALGRKAGLDLPTLRTLVAGAFLHDVGKIGIPDAILLKPAKLTPEEFETMKHHVALGREILCNATWLSQAIHVAEFHHEKFDGSGYLRGLAGQDIPVTARVFAIADVFDALTSRRPYKEPMTPENALGIMRKDAGSHFDPALFTAFQAEAARWHEEIARLDEPALTALLRAETAVLFGLSESA